VYIQITSLCDSDDSLHTGVSDVQVASSERRQTGRHWTPGVTTRTELTRRHISANSLNKIALNTTRSRFH